MRVTIPVYAIALVVVFALSGVDTKNATTTKTNNLRAYLSDTSFVTRQINCVLGRAKCDRLGGQLKKAIPEVVNRNCARCTNVQASNANKLITFIKNHYPVDYRAILNKYRSNKAGQSREGQGQGGAKAGQRIKKEGDTEQNLKKTSKDPIVNNDSQSTKNLAS